MKVPHKEKSNYTIKRTGWAKFSTCAIAGLLICVILFLSLFNKEQINAPEEKKTTRLHIKEAQPHIRKKEQSFQTSSKTKLQKVDNVSVISNSQKRSINSSPWANKPMRIIKPRQADIKPRRFVYDAEEEIAALLEIEPGTPMFGELPYTHFQKRFQQAIMQKVKISDSDDEYTKELKKQVQAVKDDLKKLMLDGGDVAAEMRKARNELKELGRYRNSLMRELHEIRKSGNYTSQDIKDFETAANKMLEEKGLKPLKVPAVLIRNMELKERKNKQ